LDKKSSFKDFVNRLVASLEVICVDIMFSSECLNEIQLLALEFENKSFDGNLNVDGKLDVELLLFPYFFNVKLLPLLLAIPRQSTDLSSRDERCALGPSIHNNLLISLSAKISIPCHFGQGITAQ